MNFWILRVFSEKRFQLAARIGEKRFINEFHGRCRAFDVEKNDADLRFVDRRHASYFAAVCDGMYLGPSKRVRNSGPRRCSYSGASSRTCPGTDGWRECGGLRRDRTSAACRAEPESSHRPPLLSRQPGPAADGYGTGPARR